MTNEIAFAALAAAARAEKKIPGAVSEWLEENVDPETGYVLDSSLTVAGAAADAKATGDAVGELKSAFEKCEDAIYGFVPLSMEGSGTTVNATNVDVVTGINLTANKQYKLTFTLTAATTKVIYCYLKQGVDDNLVSLRVEIGSTSTTDTFTPNTNYSGLWMTIRAGISGVVVKATIEEVATSLIESNTDRIEALEQNETATFGYGTALKLETHQDPLWTQGACVIGGNSVGFSASADDHSTDGNVYVGNLKTYTYTRFHHNLGHCASADYDPITDTMLVANGSTDESLPPIIYLIKNAAAVVSAGDYIAYNGQGVVAIDFTGIDGVGIIGCFGEQNNIMYIVSAESAVDYTTKREKYIYRCVLGMGSNNMRTLFPSDSYGTFISGCADDEYNGTAHILNQYTVSFGGELQGLKYCNGNLVFPTDLPVNSVKTAYLCVVEIKNTGDAAIKKNYWIPILNGSAEPISTECEDVIFVDGYGYITTFSSSSTIKKTSKFVAPV